MIDKGEKLPRAYKKAIRRNHRKARKADLKAFFKKSKFVIAAVLVIAMAAGLFLQNGNMISKMNKILNTTEVSVHEIYDDTKVIAAYKAQDPSKLNEEDTFLYNKLNSIIPSIITEGMTEYEKEKAVYDWQYVWVNFPEDSLSPISGSANTYTPYGVLTGHNAICVGNATTFKLFMDALGIPCKIIHSTENGEHAWDLVQLDEEWYHVDLTFDSSGQKTPSYAYFNVPDSIKDNGSWPWDHNEIPAANGSKYCYMLMNAHKVENMYEIPKVLSDAVKNSEGMIPVILSDRSGFNNNVANYIAENIICDNTNIYFDDVYAIGDETIYKYSSYTWGENIGNLSEEVIQKFQPIFDEINGNMYMY